MPLYQPNNDRTVASLNFANLFAVYTDNSRFKKLGANTLQRLGNSRINISRKSFSTTSDEVLLCLISLFYHSDVPPYAIANPRSTFTRRSAGFLYCDWNVPRAIAVSYPQIQN